MTYKTHVVFAVTLALPIGYFQQYFGIDFMLFLSSVVFGSLLPDLDEEGSYIGRKIPIASFLLKIFGVKHRGITHRLIFVFILGAIFYSIYYVYQYVILVPILYGLLLGYLFHLFGDMLTKGGIENFYFPISSKKGVLLPRWLRFYTGSIEELMVFSLLIAILAIEFPIFLGEVL